MSEGAGAEPSLQWLLRAFNAMLDPVAFLDRAGTVIYANQDMMRYLARPMSEIIGAQCYELFHHESGHILGCPLVRSLQTRRRETMEMIVNDKYFYVVVDPVIAPGGEIEGFIHLVRDMTDFRAAQRQLAEQAALVQIAARTARMGGWSVDLRHMRARWSDEVARIHEVEPGFSPTVEDGIAFYAPECQERIREVFTRCAREGIPYDEELEIITASGKRVPVRTCGMPVRDENGVITGVQGSFQDISEWKRVEEERRQLQAQLLLAQKIESVGRLAGGIAHDFNNLLSVVLGYVGFALDAVSPDSSLYGDLKEIQKAAERASTLTRQLLAFSRKQVFSMQVVALNDIVSGMQNMLQRLIGEDILVMLDLHPETGSIRADPGQMEQVIMNLAVNARDAMPDGGKLLIQTRQAQIDGTYLDNNVSLQPGRYAVLSVTDTGCGMDPEIRARIFDPFFTTKEKSKGTGLGLSIVHGIVTQSGGSIWVYSEKGWGTTFKLYFPLADPQTEETDEMAGQPACGRETILLVEDEPAVRTLAERMLMRAGYTVITASGKDDALALAERFLSSIDLLLTDIVMPHMSGRELSALLQKRRPGLKTLFVSGYPQDLMHVEGDDPAAGFLGKPFSYQELTRKVREILDR